MTATNQEILNEFHRQTQRWNTEASTGLLLTNAPRPLTVAGLEATARRIQHMLAENPEWASAFRTLWAAKDYAKYRMEANADILTKMHHGEPVTGDSLLELMENPNVVKMLGVTAAYQTQQREQVQRNRKIQELTGGADHYKYFDGTYGQYRRYPAAELETVDDAELQRIHDLVMGQRNLTHTPQSELRKQDAQNQRQASEEFRLINPSTGVEFTRAEIVGLNRTQLRWLIFGNSTSAKPEVSERITKILKGIA